jgi:hypothetical protein
MSILFKYPRTKNLPWSQSNSSDDVWWTEGDVALAFNGRRIIISDKMDGECTTMYRDHIHARSMDSGHHLSRDWVKRLHGQIKHEIPDGYRICGENCYAFHSIFYHLPTYFFVYGIYNDQNQCLSWDETVEWTKLLGLQTVPILYDGLWSKEICISMWDEKKKGCFPTFACNDEYPKWPHNFYPTTPEGYVVRVAHEFPYDKFDKHVAKFVRSNHVQTSSNWLTKPVVPNLLVD